MCTYSSSIHPNIPELYRQEDKGTVKQDTEAGIPALKEWCPEHLWAPGCYHGSVGQGWMW